MIFIRKMRDRISALIPRKTKYDSEIKEYLDIANSLIEEAYSKDPKNDVFEQVGLLTGKDIALEYLDYGEHGLAMEHLLYMVHESEVNFPQDKLISLHKVANKMNVHNRYAVPNLTIK